MDWTFRPFLETLDYRIVPDGNGGYSSPPPPPGQGSGTAVGEYQYAKQQYMAALNSFNTLFEHLVGNWSDSIDAERQRLVQQQLLNTEQLQENPNPMLIAQYQAGVQRFTEERDTLRNYVISRNSDLFDSYTAAHTALSNAAAKHGQLTAGEQQANPWVGATSPPPPAINNSVDGVIAEAERRNP